MREHKGSLPTLGLLVAWMCVVALAATGCIRSMVRVTSQPSDAKVTINNYERGHTPIEMPIEWYWYYQIRVEKEGCEPLEVSERFYAPPWAVFPFDLLAEALPVPIKNTYNRHYVLKPPKPSD